MHAYIHTHMHVKSKEKYVLAVSLFEHTENLFKNGVKACLFGHILPIS
jgi:hypothetical protein